MIRPLGGTHSSGFQKETLQHLKHFWILAESWVDFFIFQMNFSSIYSGIKSSRFCASLGLHNDEDNMDYLETDTLFNPFLGVGDLNTDISVENDLFLRVQLSLYIVGIIM